MDYRRHIYLYEVAATWPMQLLVLPHQTYVQEASSRPLLYAKLLPFSTPHCLCDSTTNQPPQSTQSSSLRAALFHPQLSDVSRSLFSVRSASVLEQTSSLSSCFISVNHTTQLSFIIMAARQLCQPLAIQFYCHSLDLLSFFAA